MATNVSNPSLSLRDSLDYEPQVLKFGTSGRRGEVIHLTQLEIYINALAELEYLQSLPASDGGIARGDAFYFAIDLRPSSSRFVPKQGGRGEIAQAIARAIHDAGMQAVYLGAIPTPALTFHAIQQRRGSMMITGSHIPFERNGYKTNSAIGELLKKDEAPINARVEQVRARVYAQPFADSIFNRQGLFKCGRQPLPAETPDARDGYIRRYVDFFGPDALRGRRLLAYQHSAVGRDLLVELLQKLGAEVIPAGRSETFVPIDTEAIDHEQLATIQNLASAAWKQHGPFDAIVSTDGDSDRPLLLAAEPAGPGSPGDPPCRVRFFGGDLLGMIVAEYLGADAVVVPISCNDALDRGVLKGRVEPKTRIGSPFVIAGMQSARAKGRKAVCGWEANGGFLTGCDIRRNGKILKALPTRDAMLPLLSALCSASEKNLTLSALFAQLPARYSKASLLRKFPRPAALRIVHQLSPKDAAIKDVIFDGQCVSMIDDHRQPLAADAGIEPMLAIRNSLAGFFTPELGFGQIVKLNYIDGVRIYFSNGDVAHVRPSGNADELRIYAVADTQQRADAIAAMGVAEPDGILRKLEKFTDPDATFKSFKAHPGLLTLKGDAKHYDWGGFDFIPTLIGIRNDSRRPFAELWIGAHHSGPATAQIGDESIALTKLSAAAPVELLGSAVAARYDGKLPYLLKVLDARKMLSIQAHPTIEQAREGYAREDAAGIPLNAPHRNYKDRNHKPEVHVALTEFWMLHGFAPLEEIAQTLQTVPEFRSIMPSFAQRVAQAGANATVRKKLLRELYEHLMTLPQEQATAILKPLIERLERSKPRDKNSRDYWALEAARAYPLPGGHVDRGIFCIYLLNLVHLQPGQGTFQPAGMLHAYLHGVNVELMANSDNVLRGGLTPKHMDVPELLRVLQFNSGKPQILNGEPAGPTELVYRTPAEEFELSRIQLAPGQRHEAGTDHSADILIVLEGRAAVSGAGQTHQLKRGDIILAPAAVPYTIESANEPATLYKAAIPR